MRPLQLLALLLFDIFLPSLDSCALVHSPLDGVCVAVTFCSRCQGAARCDRPLLAGESEGNTFFWDHENESEDPDSRKNVYFLAGDIDGFWPIFARTFRPDDSASPRLERACCRPALIQQPRSEHGF
jgi:hypothetical protein